MKPSLPPWIRSNPALPWGSLFLLLALLVTQYGGTNAMSRVAALRAITEGHTLSIDNYREWTLDWAKAPSGHYYSNKAPGPIFLSLPAFAATELISLPLAARSSQIDSQGRAPQPGFLPHLLVMLWLQLLPFFCLVLWCAHSLLRRGAPLAAIHFFALAALFGNTAAIYMNSNFGHGVSAVLFLAAYLAWIEARYLLTGSFFAWALLSDYGVAFALPFFLLATLLREKNLRSLVRIAVGAAPGALVWIAYHQVCFGSPFRTANQFTNPEQIGTLAHTGLHLWGEYSPFPSIEIVGKLLFGTSRGLLFTQPWMLAVFALPFMSAPRLPRGYAMVAAGSIAGLLWMNGGFGGWHGGWCQGPRYLSVVFPAMAYALALAWQLFSPWARRFLWAGLAVSLVFRIMIFPFSNLAPEANLWVYHWELLRSPDHLGTTMLRLSLVVLASVLAALWWWRRERKGVSLSTKPV